ncbi:hypothetical protein GCM10017691_11380 [Pseudonocardia petroleophila]|uniref:Uncharacterized protein n=1 Tax=Pseudonocardia petroleophila TaxID=37331 RepID=A0A7G7MIV5_9PSEU|nr:hypothetical protein [Pseudonocardia petroleophila]QNG52716.1 hypothetical protein H6H00_01165 [Pseudonocardia petroleophila]
MTVTLVRPERVNRLDLHRQVAATHGTGTAYLAGQKSWNTDCNLMGRDDVAVAARGATSRSRARRGRHGSGPRAAGVPAEQLRG